MTLSTPLDLNVDPNTLIYYFYSSVRVALIRAFLYIFIYKNLESFNIKREKVRLCSLLNIVLDKK